MPIFPVSTSWCWMKPTACWTWVFFRTSGASSSRCRKSVRRCCSRRQCLVKSKALCTNFCAHPGPFRSDAARTRPRASPNWSMKFRSTRRAHCCCTCCRSEEHTSELQSPDHLVCRLLLEKKKKRHEPQRQNKKVQHPEANSDFSSFPMPQQQAQPQPRNQPQ